MLATAGCAASATEKNDGFGCPGYKPKKKKKGMDPFLSEIRTFLRRGERESVGGGRKDMILI